MPLAGELVTETLDYAGGRPVTVYVPPEGAGAVDAVVYAGDGQWHVERLAAELEGAGVRSVLLVGVHGTGDDDGRLKEYVPGFDPPTASAHERFFVEDVRAFVGERFGVSRPAARTAVWGASLGGELALAMGMAHPDVYGVVLSASPGAGYRPPDELTGPRPRAYLVAGTEEPFFLENATRWADALRAADADADVVLEARAGDHGGDFWFEELPRMVAWAWGTPSRS